jgi:hypothetical protein
MVTFLMDLGNWYTIQESFKAQWKGTQNKSIIQENLDTQNAAFHLNYRLRAGKQF